MLVLQTHESAQHERNLAELYYIIDLILPWNASTFLATHWECQLVFNSVINGKDGVNFPAVVIFEWVYIKVVSLLHNIRLC